MGTTLGEKIKLCRNAAGETQQELGNALKVGKKQIQRYEAGEVEPSFAQMNTLAKRFKFDFFSLVREVPPEVVADSKRPPEPIGYVSRETFEDLLTTTLALKEFVVQRVVAVDKVSRARVLSEMGKLAVDMRKKVNKKDIPTD
jgi:transcriptional regulator with XRE-family HTH domain